ncbi:MAG: Na+/proline symporter/nitrogen-specific signal transduction histidine kinase [Planktomarina sp.]|jgi:Na+/proline symporter/nitrogen-specific signal transduction histidine kinase|tara:strand:- start:716 stop:3370 length:2655 start_codon:yes stop_codon:yes gene_type:complete
MLSLDLLIFVSLIYVAFLFCVAFWAERAAGLGRGGWMRTPLIYTLSLSIYCTAWTFYGAVGYAARSGLEFLTIYLGPTAVLIGWWLILRRLVRIARAERITSIADLISSRFGKSAFLGGLVTFMAVVGTTPYIALQLQSVTLSVSVFAKDAQSIVSISNIALWVAAGLAVFTIIFGTRNLDVNERHSGVVMAIAVEAIVKLFALLAVGTFVVWGLADGVGDVLARIDASPISKWQVSTGRWLGLTFLSAAAFLCLPRMFQVMVVENSEESHLPTAGWAFPLYLLLMSLFVIPIAVVGLDILPAGSNPDLFVLTLPLSAEQNGLAMLAFLGGFSSATSMVIVAAIALSTMVSNHIVTPIWLRARGRGATISGDVRSVVLISRRLSIAGILGLGYLYYQVSGGGAALASIGLISFAGVAQILPAMLGGIFWRGATKVGAVLGLICGFVIWSFTMFLPSFGPEVLISQNTIDHGLWGINWLRPTALFGIQGLDPVLHAVLWSILLNSFAFIAGSIFSKASPLERVQAVQFVSAFDSGSVARGWQRGAADAEDLLIMAQRIMGAAQAQTLFRNMAQKQGKKGYLPDSTPQFLETLERSLAGSVGAATAHAMLGQMAGGASVTVEDLMAVADETAQIMEYSSQLEAQSGELTTTARQLRDANEKLMNLSTQKDAFLTQISHELRTPMTSIRAFSEILQDPDLKSGDRPKYAMIIQEETQRLTRLLDDLLDLSVLENGQVALDLQSINLCDILNRAVASANVDDVINIRRNTSREDVVFLTDPGRLTQVFINLMSNAAKYCIVPAAELRINVSATAGVLIVDFIDNGSGIDKVNQDIIFEKFARVSDHSKAGGAGLGLSICREIINNLGGQVAYLPGQHGAAFRISLPRS